MFGASSRRSDMFEHDKYLFIFSPRTRRNTLLVMSTKMKWMKAMTSKSSFDKKAKDKDYFKSSTSLGEETVDIPSTICPTLYNQDEGPFQAASMRLFWVICNCNMGSNKKKDFLIRRELTVLDSNNGREFVKDLLVHVCELDHVALLKQGVPIVELCGKFCRFLAGQDKAESFSGSDSEKTSTPTTLPRFRLKASSPQDGPKQVRSALSSGLSPKRKRSKTVNSGLKRKPLRFDLAKAVVNSVRRSSMGVKKLVGHQFRPSERLDIVDEVAFDITNFVLTVIRNNSGHYLVQTRGESYLESLVNLTTCICWTCGKSASIKKAAFYVVNELDMATESMDDGTNFLQDLVLTMSKISATTLSKENINLDLGIGYVVIYLVSLMRSRFREDHGSPVFPGNRRGKRSLDEPILQAKVSLRAKEQLVRLPSVRRQVKPRKKNLSNQDNLATKLFI